mgnify:CR=1 FL=1
MIDPIKKSVTVPLDSQSAFELFTSGIDRWWPKETHSLSSGDGRGDAAKVRVEPAEGGKVIETLPDGSEAPWATVTDWAPGERFGMRWYVGRDEAEATQVDVRFTQTEAGTRVALSHSGFEALGDAAVAQHKGYTSGWDPVLFDCFAGCCEAVAA